MPPRQASRHASRQEAPSASEGITARHQHNPRPATTPNPSLALGALWMQQFTATRQEAPSASEGITARHHHNPRPAPSRSSGLR